MVEHESRHARSQLVDGNPRLFLHTRLARAMNPDIEGTLLLGAFEKQTQGTHFWGGARKKHAAQRAGAQNVPLQLLRVLVCQVPFKLDCGNPPVFGLKRNSEFSFGEVMNKRYLAELADV